MPQDDRIQSMAEAFEQIAENYPAFELIAL